MLRIGVVEIVIPYFLSYNLPTVSNGMRCSPGLSTISWAVNFGLWSQRVLLSAACQAIPDKPGSALQKPLAAPGQREGATYADHLRDPYSPHACVPG